MTEVNLVLGGGGVRGLAHLGVLEVLEQRDIQPVVIGGSSAGAIVGSLYAKNKDLQSVQQHLSNLHLSSLLEIPKLRTGLFSGNRLLTQIDDMLGTTTFQELKTEFYANALAINEGEIHILHDGNVAQAVRASIAVPGVLQPLRREERYYFDGSFINPLPVQGISKEAQAQRPTILVDVTGEYPAISEDSNSVEILRKYMYTTQKTFRDKQIMDTDHILIEPETHEWMLFSRPDLESLAQKGRQAAKKALNQTNLI